MILKIPEELLILGRSGRNHWNPVFGDFRIAVTFLFWRRDLCGWQWVKLHQYHRI